MKVTTAVAVLWDIYRAYINPSFLTMVVSYSIVMDLDRMFGSTKFKIPSDLSVLEKSAAMIMKAPIDPANFNQKEFLKSATDVIAIEKSLSEKMKLRWLPWSS
jgi:hypothetical protein